MTDRTIGGLFSAQVRLGAHRPALREKRGGRWVTTTWGEWALTSRAVAMALVAGGNAAGARVAILSATRQAWVEVDLGVLLAGCVVVPLYPTSSGEQLGYVLRDSGAQVLFVDDPLQVEKLLPNELADVREIVVFDARAVRDEPDPDGRRVLEIADVAARASVPIASYDEFVQRGRALLDAGRAGELDARTALVAETDTATILYTSGTTGPPKGAMLTHGGFVAEVDALASVIELGPHDEQLLFLPMAHVFGRLLGIAQLRVGFVTSFAESTSKAIDNLVEIGPTFFGSVPRMFEKIHQAAHHRARMDGELRARLFRWAVAVGLDVSKQRRRGAKPSSALALQHRYADKLVLGRVRAAFGPRFRFAISGGAPLAPELGEWFHAVGVTILEGYGLTETTGATHVSTPGSFRFGSVGKPVPGVEAHTAEDGEVLVRGPSIMKGYWRNEVATAEALGGDGWLRTGDVGVIDDDGMLTITDRKKDLIVTSGGKNVAPQVLEELLKRSAWIAHAVVYGDNKRHLVALLTLDEAAIGRWARDHGRPASIAELARDPEVRSLVALDVDAVNRKVARFEAIQRFVLLDRDLSESLGELTATMKVRRRAVYDRHRALLEALYGDER